MSVLLSVHELQKRSKTETGGLLRVLFVRLDQVPTETTQTLGVNNADHESGVTGLIIPLRKPLVTGINNSH